MRHNMEVSVLKPADDGVVRCRKIGIRERLMRLFLGETRKMTIIIPGDTVDALHICEVPEGGDDNEPGQAPAGRS